MASTIAARPEPVPDQTTPWIIIAVLCAVLIGTFWNTLSTLVGVWHDPQYSHGYLVPIFTIVLLAMRRQLFMPVDNSARWAGVGIIALALVLRLIGAMLINGLFEMLAIIPALMGIFLIAGGWSMLRWSWAPLAFLVFMMPLPEHASSMLMTPLQRVATVSSTFTLQTVGVDAYYTGNQIKIGEGFPLNVEEQCSGLRMCTIFLAMAVAMTMITERPWWQNGIIIASAIPIAVLVNLIRIVITAILYLWLGPDSEVARQFFHNLAGWFMMPLAFAFLYGEMVFLEHIFVEDTSSTPMIVGFGKSPAVKRPAPTSAH